MTTDTLKARRLELLDMMPDPAHVMRASLITRSIKCGKPNCRCANGEGHKSLYLSSYYNGKTQLDSVPKSYQDKISGVFQKHHIFVDNAAVPEKSAKYPL